MGRRRGGGRRLAFVGGRLAAQQWGPDDGAAAICWHGAGGSSEDYAAVGSALAGERGTRVIAVDAPGHARSSSFRPPSWRPSALAKIAAAVLDELSVENATFIGFSWGAAVGCWFAALFPDRTQALVLLEGGHLDFGDLPGFDIARTLDQFIEEAENVAAENAAAFANYSPDVAGHMVWGLCAEPARSTYERLAQARIPVLFLTGGHADDTGLITGATERLRNRVPQTVVVELPSRNHDLLLDVPEAVAEAISRWLREHLP